MAVSWGFITVMLAVLLKEFEFVAVCGFTTLRVLPEMTLPLTEQLSAAALRPVQTAYFQSPPPHVSQEKVRTASAWVDSLVKLYLASDSLKTKRTLSRLPVPHQMAPVPESLT